MTQASWILPTKGALRQRINFEANGEQYIQSTEDVTPLIEENTSIRQAKEAVRGRNGIVSHRWPAILWYAEFPAEFERRYGMRPNHSCPPSIKATRTQEVREGVELLWKRFIREKSNNRDYSKFRTWEGRI